MEVFVNDSSTPDDDVGSMYAHYGNATDDAVAATNSSDPKYFATNYRIIGTVFGIIIFFVGVVGNVMVVVVVRRTKSMQSPTNCYLVSLAIADCLVLFAAVPNEVIGYYLLVGEWIWGKIGCSLLVFLQYLGINVSSLSITAFTIERYIAICHPMKAQVVCTMERAKKIIIGLWAFAILYCAPWLPLTRTMPLPYKGVSKESCEFKLSREMYTWIYLGDFVLFYVIPLLLSCVLYGLIGKILFTSTIPKSLGTCKSNGHAGESKKNTTSSRVQVVKMLVVVVVLFAILWMPYRFILVYNSFRSLANKSQLQDYWYFMFAKTLIYINSAINPILYNAMSVKFRRAFKHLLTCGREDDPRGYYSRTMSTVV
ncbi:PREDICTED: thyrotropin-releasing hormone receptor-like [Priapulus caudatus]|uniref:Thyrotropin-releasing hormone receptor n=1 Tax=Priapulus caudatus TaxID=37621 RepID=A0ABM1DTV7_PRICU|nr:PREDICTED: thyrotropin-releasing hormone receptor-like [Priapulus caudatus]